ncbi:hypothetical protein [Aquimarina sediminis]|uniref:hypothetical protein n=1 Tax=Aquimarina sediminis TaxID=2070536 RepID=UPI000CA0036C|nr:hypothetical protein [Aquimarina sediminis]
MNKAKDVKISRCKLFYGYVFLCLIGTKVYAQETYDYSFLEAYEFIELPLVEKTKFDKNSPKGHLTLNQKKALGFEKISKHWKKSDCGVLHKLHLTELYKTLLVYVYNSQKHISIILVNYDEQYNIVGKKLVAFDENAKKAKNAEFWEMSESIITKDRIHRKDVLFVEPEQIEYVNFIYSDDGRIIRDIDFYKGKISDSCFHSFEPQEVKYVKALNGLEVKDQDGNTTGKLEYGSKVEIIKYTNKKQSIKNGGKTINGVIVEICNCEAGYFKRRYIFDGHLTKDSE